MQRTPGAYPASIRKFSWPWSATKNQL